MLTCRRPCLYPRTGATRVWPIFIVTAAWRRRLRTIDTGPVRYLDARRVQFSKRQNRMARVGAALCAAIVLPQNEDVSVSRPELEAKLKQTIGAAKENGSLYTLDWDIMPLPQSLVKAERAAVVGASAYNPSPNSRKRKSSDLAEDSNPAPPWKSTNNGLEGRVSFAPKDRRTGFDETSKSSKFQKDASKRKRRFESEYLAANVAAETTPSSGPIVGTCEVLEKRYLRLTAPPVASNVRPERILRQTLDLLKRNGARRATILTYATSSSRCARISLSSVSETTLRRPSMRSTPGLRWRRGILVSITSARPS